MKNLFFYFRTLVVLAVLFISCDRNSDEETTTPAPAAGVLPKTILETFKSPSGTSNFTVSFSYDGNKIKEITSNPNPDIGSAKFTYTGDNITKIETYVNTALSQTWTLEYTNDKLTKAVTNGATMQYTYNSDGTVTVDETYSYYGKSTRIYSLNADNSVKIVTNPYSTAPFTQTRSFDDKKNIFLNITGLNKIVNADSFFKYLFPGKNNLLSIENNGTVHSTYVYEYNGEGYPKKRTMTSGSRTLIWDISY